MPENVKKGRKKMIDLDKLLRQKKWNAEKLGQLIIAMGVNDIKYNETGHMSTVLEKIRKETPKLTKEEREVYQEYATVYTLLYIIQKDIKLGDIEFWHGISKLCDLGFEIEAYTIFGQEGKNIAELKKENGTIDNAKLEETINTYVQLTQEGFKRVFAVYSILSLLAIIYSPHIKEIEVDLSPYKEQLKKYNIARVEMAMSNQKVVKEKIATLFPEITTPIINHELEECLDAIGHEAITTAFTKNNSHVLYMRLYEWIDALINDKPLNTK